MAELARFLAEVGVVAVEETLAKLRAAGATEQQLRTTVPEPAPPGIVTPVRPVPQLGRDTGLTRP